MPWDNRYRQLQEGEIVRAGDEFLGPDDRDQWEPVRHGIGRRVPDPLPMGHVRYRRIRSEQAS